MYRYFFGIRADSRILVATALLVACGSEGGVGQPVENNPATPDAGDVDADLGDAEPDTQGSFELPAMPAECDGPPQHLARWAEDFAYVRQIRATEESVYVSVVGTPDGLFRIPVSGGPPVSLLDKGVSPPQDFWIEQDSILAAINGSLYHLPLTGGTLALLEGHAPDQDTLAFCYGRDASHLYWLSETGMGKRLKRVAIAGGEVETLGDGPNVMCPLGLDDTHVVVSDMDGVIRFPKAGGEGERIFEGDSVQLLSTSPPWVVNAYTDDIPGVALAVMQLGDDGGDEPTVLLADMWTLPVAQMARVDGHTFLLGRSDFSVSDDRRSATRLRVYATEGDSLAEPVGCVTPVFDPLLDNGGDKEFAFGMAANSTAVYVVASPFLSGQVRIAEVKR